MQDFTKRDEPISLVDDTDSIARLLAALGDWGVAEVRGEPNSTLDDLESRALDAYKAVSSAA